jgi:hypothetical protein
MTNFLRFHINLILENKTTIEFLEAKGEPFESRFSINTRRNWQQVFGPNKFFWIFPINVGAARPNGDGVFWPTTEQLTDPHNTFNSN